MGTRTLPGWVGLVAGAIGAGIAAGVGYAPELTYLMDVHPGVAGWVQAVGSIVAIFAAIGVAAWQNHRAHEEARSTERRRDIVKLKAAYAAISEGVSAAASVYEKCRTQSRPMDATFYRVLLQNALDSIKALPAADAPEPGAVVALSLAKLQVSQYIPVIGDLAEHSQENEFTDGQIEFAFTRAKRMIELANDVALLLPVDRRPDLLDVDRVIAAHASEDP